MPRAGLTKAKVVERAAALADERGYDALTLAVVAADFGVRVPSLYKHVDGLDGLRREISELAAVQLTDRLLPAVDGLSGADLLLAVVRCYREFVHRHPGRALAYVRNPVSPMDRPPSATLISLLSDGLADLGVPEPDLVPAAIAVRSTMRGFVFAEVRGELGDLGEDVFDAVLRVVDRLLGAVGGLRN